MVTQNIIKVAAQRTLTSSQTYYQRLHTSSRRHNRMLALGLADLVLISCQVARLCRSSIATNDGRVPVEVLGDLLERGVLGLDEPLPDNERLEGDPADVDEVVLPSNSLQGDGIDVLIEPEGDVDEQEHDSEALVVRF